MIGTTTGKENMANLHEGMGEMKNVGNMKGMSGNGS